MIYNPLTEVVDETLTITPKTVDELSLFRLREPKLPMLPGINVHEERARLSKIVNGLVDSLIQGIETHPSKLWVMTEFQRALESVESEDTEAREHFGLELEQIMDILGIESSDGLLSCYLGGI
jgi:Domain of unknown function (DUF4844)